MEVTDKFLETQLRGKRKYGHTITNTTIETVMKNFPVNKIEGQDGLKGKFYEPLREMLTHTLLKIFQNTTVVGKPANSSYEYSITLISKLKITQKREIIDQYLCIKEQ